MKKVMAIMSAMLLTLSCHNSPRHAGSVRGMEDIFDEAVRAVTDTSSGFSADKAEALLNELGDTLLSIMATSDLNDVAPRLAAQEMASYAVFFAADHAERTGSDVESCVGKFTRVMSTWRIRTTGDGVDYLKEIPYMIGQDTDDQSRREMYIIAKTDPEQQTVILLPPEATGGASALFTRIYGEDEDPGDDGPLLLDGGEGELDTGWMVYRFDSGAFMEALGEYDALFVIYGEEDGTHESAMVLLDEFHRFTGQD